MKGIKLDNVKKVLRWEFSKSVISPTFLILTFLIPIIMVISGGIGFFAGKAQSEKDVSVAIIDETGDFYPFLEENLENKILTTVRYEPEQLDEVEALLLEGKYHGYMTLTKENIASGNILFYSGDIRDVNLGVLTEVLKPIFSKYRLKGLGLSPEQISTASIPLSLDVRSIKGDEVNFADYILPLIASVILIFAVMLSGQVLMYGIIKEKQNKIVEILLSSISSLELLIGKIIGYGLLSLVQMAIWILTGLIVAGRFIDLNTLQFNPGDFILPFFFFFFGYFMLSSLFAAVGATMKEAQEGSQIQGLFTIIPMFPMFLSAPIIMAPNALWVRILSHIPPFIPSMVLLRMGQTKLPSWEIASTLVALILSTYIFVKIGARIFEGGIMKYDRTYTFKDLRTVFSKNK